MTKLEGEVDGEVISRDFPEEYSAFKKKIEAAGDDASSARWQINRDFFIQNGWSSTSITVTTVMFVDHVIVKREVDE